MDYEKEYKKLKADIKKAYLFAQTDSTKAVLEHILPELRESEDEKRRKIITLCLEECVHSDIIRDYEKDDAIAWLEKQGQKPTWSEEDECMLNNVINVLEPLSQTTHSDYAIKSMITWLKSIKPQNRWKPTDEQMEALANALSLAKNCGDESSFDLRTLYDDLAIL